MAEPLDLDALEREFRNSDTKMVWADVAIDLIQRLQEWDKEFPGATAAQIAAEADEQGAYVKDLRKRIVQLETALVLTAIPLEALNMDNSNGAKWMTPSMKEAVKGAVTAIRAAFEVKE